MCFQTCIDFSFHFFLSVSLALSGVSPFFLSSLQLTGIRNHLCIALAPPRVVIAATCLRVPLNALGECETRPYTKRPLNFATDLSQVYIPQPLWAHASMFLLNPSRILWIWPIKSPSTWGERALQRQDMLEKGKVCLKAPCTSDWAKAKCRSEARKTPFFWM